MKVNTRASAIGTDLDILTVFFSFRVRFFRSLPPGTIAIKFQALRMAKKLWAKLFRNACKKKGCLPMIQEEKTSLLSISLPSRCRCRVTDAKECGANEGQGLGDVAADPKITRHWFATLTPNNS